MRNHILYIASMAALAAVLTVETPVLSRAETGAAVEAQVSGASDDAGEEEVQDLVDGADTVRESPEEADAGEVEQETASAEGTQAGSENGQGESTAETKADERQNLVAYALQFVGRPYRSGGSDPHTGADCSGFVRYVMQHGAGINMNRSSREQAKQGVPINAAQMQPGDLLFYGNGSRINHVAMYIGDGKVVHASTERTGIKTSVWNYRVPIKIVNVLG